MRFTLNQQHLLNLKQIEAYHDESRFKYILAGRRGGKTFLVKEDIVKSANQCPSRSDIFYIGPTNQQAKELIWDDVENRLWQLGWKYKTNATNQCFELSRGRKIYVIGAEKIRRIRGHRVYKAYLDELAYFSTPLKEVWKAVRPALSDLRGKAIASTTPDGKGSEAYDFYLDTLRQKDWKFHHWFTADNPHIDPTEIEDAKRELDEKSFRQEYMAYWESFEGLAYYNIDEQTHIKEQPPLDLKQPIILCFDFNVNPTTLLLAQKDKSMIRFKKEYSQKHSSTPATVTSFCEDYKHLAGKVHLKIRGDASGNSRKSNTGRSDYQYAQEVLEAYGFQYTYEVLAQNPAIIDRVATFNAYLKNFHGESRFEVDPSCKDLIKDLTGQELDGRFPSDRNNLGHKADAAGYCIYWDHLISSRKEQRTISL